MFSNQYCLGTWLKVLLSDIPMPMDLEPGAQAPLSVPLFRGLPELLTHASVHMYVCAYENACMHV